jgi:plastocyanin
MTHTQFDRRTLLSVGAIGGVASALGLRTGLAQDATPAAGGEVAHPAHIHSGTCEELGDVVFPLNDIAPINADATPAASAAASPAAGGAGEVVAESTSQVDASLEELLASEAYAINVHESAENIGNYIACGNLTGPATDGELHIELQELNDSGYTGEAHLVENGDGTTTVTVTLMMTGDEAATPVAGGQTHIVEMTDKLQGLQFDPDHLTIRVGDTVTWRNVSATSHTSTCDPEKANNPEEHVQLPEGAETWDSGLLNTDEEFSHTFEVPGEYTYFCIPHEAADMVASLTVEE